jgi:TIR domain-containing protein
VAFIVNELHRLESGMRLFVDRRELNPGASWQQKLFEALDSSRRVLTTYSPAYLRSKVCMEEFNIAWARNRDTDEDVIYPIYLYEADLPTYMTLPDYVDCRPGSHDRISAACASLAAALRSSP